MEFNIQKVQTFIGHKNSVYSLCGGIHKNDFFSVSSDKLVVQWDIANSEHGIPLLKLISSSYAIHFNEQRGLLFVSDNNQAIRVVDLDSKEVINNIPLINKSVFDIVSHDNKLYVCDNLGNLSIYSLDNFESILSIKMSDKNVRKVIIIKETNELAIAFSDFSIKIIDLNDYTIKFNLQSHQNSVFSLFFDCENKVLISGGRDARLIAWDMANFYKEVHRVPAHLYTINHIEDLKGTPYFATASLDKTIKIWEKGSLTLKKVIDRSRFGSHSNSVNRLLWKPLDQVLISTGDDRSILMWKLF